MNKEDVVHIYNEILLSHKKNKIMPPATPWISQRERQISYDITYMWNLKKMIQANLFIKQKLTHKCRKQTYGYKGERWGEINEEFGISICICMLLYIKQTKK